MITIILVSLITVLFYLLWKTEKKTKPEGQYDSSGKVPLWLLLGILSILALLSPKIRDKVNELRDKHHL